MKDFFWRSEWEKNKNERRKAIFDFGERCFSVCEINLSKGPKLKKLPREHHDLDVHFPIPFLPSKYFSKKFKTSQILIGKGTLVFKTYWPLKTILTIILKITSGRIMMRDRKKNSITHLKNQVGTYFRILGNKMKTKVSVWTSCKKWRLSFSIGRCAHSLG